MGGAGTPAAQVARSIAFRAKGSQHGFIRRMVSPGELGERLKPFVFLDYVNAHVADGAGFGWHPHSGIATLTYQLNADADYEDTAGQKGLVEATGLEWMRAGGGTWHQGHIHPHAQPVCGFQTWFALPPGVEEGPAEGLYVAPKDVPQVGNVRVLLGEYKGHANPIPPPSPIVYLDVVLAAGESWWFTPPADHTVAWAFPYSGNVLTCGEEVSGALIGFNESTAKLEFKATEPSRMLLGSAKQHDYPLVLGRYSVHTSAAALEKGEANIQAVGAALREAGRM